MTELDPIAGSALARVEDAPLRPETSVASFGTTLVVAPHPDDETLGCGGAIALLRRAGCNVRVVVVSDGAASHPNSTRYPPSALRALREQETIRALGILGVAERDVTFLRLPDTAVPSASETGFDEVVGRCRRVLRQTGDGPGTVFLPWRRDPHRDHRAVWSIVRAAVGGDRPLPRLVEYPIWVWELSQHGDPPATGEMNIWRLDITSVLCQKQDAIAAYRSQTTPLIDDDPKGFFLTPEMLRHFSRPWELYLEERHDW